MTAFYKDKGSSLYDALLNMYVEYGLYKEELVSITKKGKTGAEDIKAMMEKFRNNPPATLGGSKIDTLKDYELGVQTDLKTGVKTKLELPKSDVLQFITADGSIVSARPSGTEPKIKFYCSVNAPLINKADFKTVDAKLGDKIKAVMNDLEV
ncbi:Phosphoglucomutase [compost metagenome]